MSAPAPVTEPVPTTLKLARFVVGHRYAVMAALILTTLFFLYPIINAGLTAYGHGLPGPVVRVDTKARALYPDHPFIHAQDKYAKEFGGSQLVAVAVVVKDGTIFTPEVIQKISRITKELDGVGYDSKTKERAQLRDKLDEQGDKTPEEIITILDRTYPPYPVNHDQVQSVAARSTRVVQVEADGSINNDVLMKKEPETAEEAEALRELVRQNPPFIFGRLVSRDEKGALIMAGFVSDRLNSREVYEAVFHHVQGIKEREQTDNVQIFVSGQPILTGWVLKHAFEIGLFVALTVIATFALLLAYFRRIHGVLIPFIAAITTFIWGLGFTGWWGIYFDPLVLVIPMIITARAVSHTVQMAERFFEDYEIILPMMDNDPEKAKVEAATVAMAELIVPGSLGIVTDFAGLLVILITTIPQLRDLATFGSFWVLCILATVEILHPVMICFLPPPHSGEHYLPPFMVKLLSAAGRLATGPRSKYAIAGITLALLVVSTYITVNYSTIGEARPGSPLLWPEHEFNVATTEIAERFGGVSSLVVYSAGDRANSSADGEPIHRKEDFERWMKTDTNLGATVSLVPFIRGSWQINHYGDPKWYFVPGDTATVRSIIFQLQTNGPPGFLRPYMTDDGKDSNIQFFYPDSKGETIRRAVHAAESFIEANPIGEVDVRLDQQRGDPKASAFSYGRVMDFVYYFLGPLLPTRSHDLNIRLRQEDKTYQALPVNDASKGLPAWIDEFRDAAHENYENAKNSVAEGEFFTWPASAGEWTNDDVDHWWEDTSLGIRAVAADTDLLLVQDMKSVDKFVEYQPTKSWTRGVQFVMSGGVLGILAAINEEVERGHIANISLILFVIFVLQWITYGSAWSGTILVTQLATATMMSLAYMAMKGVGLNINTLPVQSVGVGIGVDYAIYIVDRIKQEMADSADLDEAIRRSVRTTGMAVSFTASCIVVGIALWMFSNLRFQAEMAQLLVILMVINMIGALTSVPAFYAIIRPPFALAEMSAHEREKLRLHRELEMKRGLG
jgi:predicted RND superfamily exporter protein